MNEDFISNSRVINSIAKLIKIYHGNPAIVFFNNDKSRSRSKYIDIKYPAIRYHVKEHEVDIQHNSIEFMIAYPMTK